MSDITGYIEKGQEILDSAKKDLEEFVRLKEEVGKSIENRDFTEDIKKKIERMFELDKIINIKHNTAKNINKIASKKMLEEEI